MVTYRVLADQSDLCGEGPLWDAEKTVLYWTDIARRRVMRHHWLGHQNEILTTNFEVAGLALHAAGGFVATNSSGAWLWDLTGTPRLLASQAEGQRCRLNDCVVDPAGRLFSGSYVREGEAGSGYLFRFDTDGSCHVVDDGIIMSNGLGFSSECRILYLADSLARTIYAYDYNALDGTVRNRRAWVRVPVEEGLPDGLTVDAEGFVWSANWYGRRVIRYDPDGRIERGIPSPALQTTSLTFGGPELNDLFLTSASTRDSTELAPPGYSQDSFYIGGRLFHLNLDIRGRLEYRSQIIPPGPQT